MSVFIIAESEESQFDMLKKLELDIQSHHELISYCQLKNIMFLSTPFDYDSIKLLNELGLEIFKIPSGEIPNLPYLLKMVFVSNYDEIKTTQETIQETTQETTQEITRDKIIRLLKANSKYTKKDLVTLLNKGDSTIKEHLDRLKRDGVIERMGSAKAGYGEVIDG